MTLTSGQRLGAYEILGSLGAGGMGEVYRARDTKLQREVAIKVLPEALAADRDRLARFEREAQLLAALNHAHIAGIYGVDTAGQTPFLVLELVEGDTLADRIARGGALSTSEAIGIARQIAEALQAAHDKGIVHRDLKPANIALTADGHVKVLDFGLAKAMEMAPAAQSSVPAATLSPTLSLAMTEAGMILGTAAYMSPEQAKGRPADKRSDVWAFGCVLFEMLTGKRAFEGEDASDTLAGILRGEPDWKALPRGTPAYLREVLTGCLTKDRKQRLADIAVVGYLLSEPRHLKAAAASPSNRRKAALAGGLVVLLGAAIGITWWLSHHIESPAPVMRFSISSTTDFPLQPTTTDRHVALSPDGATLAFIAGLGQLVLRRFDRLEVEPIRTVPDARVPFWSPDGKWIGFTVRSTNELQKVSVTGGPPVMVSRGVGAPRGATWGPDQTIVFATTDSSTGLLSVSASGGDPKVITRPDAKRGEVDHLFPSYLPNGKGVLFTITTSVASADSSQIAVLDFQTGAYKVVVRGGSSPEYVAGFLVYAVGGTLRAIRFDQEHLEVIGDPVPVVAQVAMGNTGVAEYSTSRSGSLVHVAGGVATAGVTRSLVWVDRKGLETAIREVPGRAYTSARLSGDDSRIAVSIEDQQRDIYVYDVRTQSLRQVTFGPALDSGPAWYANDERLLFFSQRDGPANLYSQRADGVGAAERITKSNDNHFIPTISPDGAVIVMVEQGSTGSLDLTMVRLNPNRVPGTGSTQANLPATKTESLIATMSAELHPDISPDGRWIAYTSDQSGRRQVIVQPFPSLQGQWKVSVDAEGGDRPVWSRGGKELFYASLKGTIMAVSYEDTPTFAARTPVRLFDWPTVTTISQGRSFDVSRDGQRFLMIKDGGADNSKAPPTAITVSLNWIEELKEKLPAK